METVIFLETSKNTDKTRTFSVTGIYGGCFLRRRERRFCRNISLHLRQFTEIEVLILKDLDMRGYGADHADGKSNFGPDKSMNAVEKDEWKITIHCVYTLCGAYDVTDECVCYFVLFAT